MNSDQQEFAYRDQMTRSRAKGPPRQARVMSNRGLLATMVGALLVTVGPVEIRAQTRASSRPVSPTVFASYISRGEHLTLLVLWRGSPGWFWSVEGGSGGAGGSGDRMFQVVNAGGLTFRIEYDFQAGTATVEGRTVTLNDTNVVLVDNVDQPNGPVIAATLFTEPVMDQMLHPETGVIRRHVDLYEFLQCELRLPSSPDPVASVKQAVISTSCEQMKGR